MAGLRPVGLAWALAVPVLGVTQTMILNGPGDPHWIVRLAHLLVGVGAIGFANRLASAILVQPAPAALARSPYRPIEA